MVNDMVEIINIDDNGDSVEVFPVEISGTTSISDLPAFFKGSTGLSAYEVWLKNGNVGTEQDFLDSLSRDVSIKTINGESLVGEGNLILNAELPQFKTINNESIIGEGNITVNSSGLEYDDTQITNRISSLETSFINHNHTWSNILDKPTEFTPLPHTHSYNSLTDLPDTFIPASHQHPIGEITGLQTVLDGKATSSHTHDYGSITGKPSSFTPSAHTHAIDEVTGLQTVLDAKLANTTFKTVNDIVITGSGNIPFDWNSITGKPSEYNPTSHTHSYNDLLDKPTLLQGEPGIDGTSVTITVVTTQEAYDASTPGPNELVVLV